MPPRSPFAIANFRYYWTARLASMLAQSAMLLIIGWQVYNIARDGGMSPAAAAAQLGFIGLIQFVPLFVLTPITGWVADRLDRRTVARATAALQGLCALALGWFTWQDAMSLWVLFIVAGASLLLFLMGVGATRLLAPDLPVVLSPLMGVAVIVALSYYVSLLGMSMTRASWGILALGAGTTVAAMVIRKSAAQFRRRQSVWLISLTVVMLLVGLLSLWDFGRPSSVQNTYASYVVAMSEYWKGHSLHELPALDPYRPLDYLVRERILHHYVDAPPVDHGVMPAKFGLVG
jgi:hypothetical protein